MQVCFYVLAQFVIYTVLGLPSSVAESMENDNRRFQFPMTVPIHENTVVPVVALRSDDVQNEFFNSF